MVNEEQPVNSTPAQNRKRPILSARQLTKQFASRSALGLRKGAVTAVESVDIDLYPGETYALVGESGSGKSTTGRLLQGLIAPTSGEITYEGQVIGAQSEQVGELRRGVQMIFQDPYSSLNPRRRVRQILEESLKISGVRDATVIKERVREALHAVGFDEEHAHRFPHEFSGGQKQRIGIARALIVGPQVVICDEPVSALDVSIQAQVLLLLRKLQRDHGLTYLFITHDMGVVKYMADRVGVMYRGKLVEQGDAKAVLNSPSHSYTRELLDSVPITHPRYRAQR